MRRAIRLLLTLLTLLVIARHVARVQQLRAASAAPITSAGCGLNAQLSGLNSEP